MGQTLRGFCPFCFEIQADRYTSHFFLHQISKILAFIELRSEIWVWDGQNIEPQGLARKILRNKELAPGFAAVLASVLLGKQSSIFLVCSFCIPSKGRASQDGDFLLWKAVEIRDTMSRINPESK
jgi:hypothetical protein